MKTSGRILSLFLIAILITACGGSSEAEPTTDIDFVLTSGVETMVASYFQTQTAAYTPPVDTSTPFPESTNTSAPTITVPTLASSPTVQYFYFTPTLGTGTPSLTPGVTGTVLTATVDPASVASGCNNLALVSHVSIPDGTTFRPGTGFTKTWKVANTGTCDWKHSYRLVFVSGDQMGGSAIRVGNAITPGKWTQFSVNMVAPDKTGTYTGTWRLSDTEGKLFGASLPVSIKVGTPPADTPVPPTSTSIPTATTEAPSATPETTAP